LFAEIRTKRSSSMWAKKFLKFFVRVTEKEPPLV